MDTIIQEKITPIEGRPGGTQIICLCCTPRGDTSKQVLVVLKGIDTTTHFKRLIISAQTMTNIETVNPEDAKAIYGERAKFGAVVIDMKADTKLVPLAQLYEHFSIDKKYRSLPICLDDDFITESSKIRADLSVIKRMEVTEGNYWFYTKPVDKPQKYINIVTK